MGEVVNFSDHAPDLYFSEWVDFLRLDIAELAQLVGPTGAPEPINKEAFVRAVDVKLEECRRLWIRPLQRTARKERGEPA